MPSSIKSVAIDTGVFVALAVKTDPNHYSCQRGLQSLSRLTKFYTVESCLVEAAFLLNPRQFRVVGQLIEGLDVSIIPLDRIALARACELMERYHDLPADFADAALIAACERTNIQHVLTTDKKDFAVYRPRHCTHFTIIPG